MLRSRVVHVTVALLLAQGALACGASAPPPVVEEPPPPPPPPRPAHLSGDRELRGVVGPAGGSISLSSGLRIEIPEGALREDVTFEVDVASDAHNAWSAEEGEVESGLVYDLRPLVTAEEGHRFTISAPGRAAPAGFESARVVLGMEEERPRRDFTDVVQTRWQYMRARREGERYVAEVALLGGHRMQFGLVRE